jgi:hypothetical protein
MSEESKTRDAWLENAIQYYHGWYPNSDAPGPVASIARLFGVNRNTLSNQLRNRSKSITGNGGQNRLLTPGEEAGLMKYVYNQIYMGYPCTGPIILDLVHHFLKLRDPDAKHPSSRFLQDLVQRHPEIHSVTSKPMDTKRKAAHDKSVIKPWYKLLELGARLGRLCNLTPTAKSTLWSRPN